MCRPHASSCHRKPLLLLLMLTAVLLWQPPSAAASPPPEPPEPPEMKSQAVPYYEDGYCGDWTCNIYEDCSSCPDDCGYCYDYCGDGICQSSESCSDCSSDCGSCSENRSVVVGTKRYWAEYAANAIWRSNLDGSQVELVHSVNGPYGIGYDPAAGYLIWTSSADETVQAAPAAGGGVITLQSSFEEYFAIAFKATGQTETAAPAAMTAMAAMNASSTTSLSYSVIGSEVVKLTQDINTGAEQREVLLTLSSPDEVHGLTLSADGTALYLGDPVGRMSRKLDIGSHGVEWLLFDDYSSLSFSTLSSPEAAQ